MAQARKDRLDQPREVAPTWFSRRGGGSDRFGQWSERFARYMGTATFLIQMTVFVIVYVLLNTLAPERFRFDPYSFTFLTLVLSLQASYAAPLILLAQNRQDDRDRVALEQDRARDERNLADTEFLTREVASLRIAMRDVATRDFVRSELRDLLQEMDERDERAKKAKAKLKIERKAKRKAERRAAAAQEAAKAARAARRRPSGATPVPHPGLGPSTPRPPEH